MEMHNFDLNDGHIQVYFAARKLLRDKKSIAERLQRGKPAGGSTKSRDSLPEP